MYVPLTVTAVPVSEQLVVPYGSVHPVPVTVALPASFPVPVEPTIVNTDVLLDENDPPLQLAGAESAVVLCAVIVEGEAVTAPVVQF